MEKGLTKKDIDDFYACVDKLGLKFPGAAISKATGWSKGNVSAYLSKKMEPSENFLKAFYEKFPKSSDNVPREMKNAPVDRFQADTDRSVKYVGEVLEKRKDSNLESLIESNRMMAAAMLADAENRTRLTKSNESLTLRVVQSENGLSETLEVFGATLATLREFVLELCVKAKTHHSIQETRAAFRIRLNEFLKNKKGENIRDGLGK